MARSTSRRVVALHDTVHLTDVDDLVKAAPDPGEIFVDLQDDQLRLVQDALGHPGAHRQIEITVAVHRGDAHHSHVYLQKVPVVGDHIPINHGNIVA